MAPNGHDAFPCKKLKSVQPYATFFGPIVVQNDHLLYLFFYSFVPVFCNDTSFKLFYSDESEDGLDSNPLLPQPGGPLMQVKEEPTSSLLGESSGAGSSGMLNTHSLNGVLQSGRHTSELILLCVGR